MDLQYSYGYIVDDSSDITHAQFAWLAVHKLTGQRTATLQLSDQLVVSELADCDANVAISLLASLWVGVVLKARRPFQSCSTFFVLVSLAVFTVC